MQFLLELDYIYLMYTMREFWGVIFTSWTERIENKFLKDERGMPFVFYLKKNNNVIDKLLHTSKFKLFTSK